jgi:hypothetical protein
LSRLSGTLRIMRQIESRFGPWLMTATRDGDLD